MAFTYGTVTNCKTYNGQTRKEYECRLGYEVQSQSIANNTSSVKLRLQVRSISSSYSTYGYNQTTTIDGTALAAKSFDMRDTNTWKTFGERTITVTHNAEGKYSASKSGSFTTTGNSTWNLKSGSASVTVSPAQIPRYATSNQSLASRTSSSITMNWSSDNTVDYIWYSKDNGSNWTGVDVTDGTSGSYTISGLSANTTYNIKTRVRRKDSQLTTDSSTLAVTTHATTSPSIWVSSKTVNSVVVASSCNVDVSSTRYRIMKSGGSYGSWQTGATFGGLSPNTTYTVQVEKVGTASGEYGYATVSVTTYQIATLSSAPSFNHGSSVTIGYSNPGGNNVSEVATCISFTGALDDIGYRAVSKTGTSYTYNFTDAELDTLYKKFGTGNSYKATMFVRTTCNNTVYHNTKEFTLTLVGNQKTGRMNVSNSWKRAKLWVNVNGTWKRAVGWVNVSGTWKRTI